MTNKDINDLSERVAEIISRLDPIEKRLEMVCRELREYSPKYDWVGVYLVEGSTLNLAAYAGDSATQHTKDPYQRRNLRLGG